MFIGRASCASDFCALQDVYVVSEYRTTWPRWYIQVQHVVYVDLETAFTIWRFNYLITVDSLISASQHILVLQEHIRAVLDNLEAWRTSKERKEAKFGNRKDSLPSWISWSLFPFCHVGFAMCFTGFETQPSDRQDAVPVRISTQMSTRMHKKATKVVCQQAPESLSEQRASCSHLA